MFAGVASSSSCRHCKDNSTVVSLLEPTWFTGWRMTAMFRAVTGLSRHVAITSAQELGTNGIEAALAQMGCNFNTSLPLPDNDHVDGSPLFETSTCSHRWRWFE